MPLFPKIIQPFEDELLYSYLRRLSNEYCEPEYFKFLNHWFRGTQRKLKNDSQMDRYDTSFDISGLLRTMLNISDEYPVDFYLNHSIYSFCAPLWADYQKADWLLNQFRPDTVLVPHVYSDLVDHLRYCPVCMNEERERGEARHYHLSHNLPGVTACWKHNVKLKVFDQKDGLEMEAQLSEETEPCSEWEARYAVFAKDLSKAKINGNLNITAAAIRDKINKLTVTDEQSIPAKPVNFREAIKRVKNLNGFTLKSYMEQLTGLDVDIDIASYAASLRKGAGEYQQRYSLEKTLSVIMCLFSDIEEFQNYVHYNTPEDAFNEMIQKRNCELISAYHPHLVILQHDRHMPFITSPELIVNGWGCPQCENKLTPQQLFRKIFEMQKGDEYELLSDFEGYSRPVRVRHNECGNEYTQKPVKLIKRNVPCKCHLDVNNIERASKWLQDHYPQFEILSFTDMNAPVTLFCNDCATASTYPDFYYFMERPRCRHCNPYTYDKERIEDLIRDLVGNEYTLVTPFTYMKDESALFRHNICGSEFSCSPERFTRGVRCQKCRTKMTIPELNTYLKTLTGNTYEIIGRGEKSPDLCTVRNNRTGEVQQLHRTMILQELNRPTPSLILETTDDPVGFDAHKEISEKLELFLRSHPAFLKSDFKEYCGEISEADFDGIFSSFLQKRRIRLISKAAGIYEDMNSNLSCMEIVESTLIKDHHGNHRGYFTGKSFLSQLKGEEYNDMVMIVSNVFDGKKKISLNIKNRRVSASGSRYGLVMNENWKSMCLLTWTIGTTFSSDESVMSLIRCFASDMEITEEMMERYSSALDKRIFGRYKKLIQSISETQQSDVHNE